MRLYISTILILLFTSNVFSQKKIHEAPIEESNLKIEAEATSVSKVKIIITPTIEYNKEKVGIDLPITFEAAPFNELSFASNFKDNLKKLYNYQATTKKITNLSKSTATITEDDDFSSLAIFIKNQFTPGELAKHLKKTDPNEEEIIAILRDSKRINDIKQDVRDKLESHIVIFKEDFYIQLTRYFTLKNNSDSIQKYYESKKIIDERTSALFRYFEAQLVLIYKYDTEPVAGTLFYNTVINNVQYFQSVTSEKYFDERAKNYHALIKKLRIIQRRISLNKTNPIDTTNFDSTFIKNHLIKYNELNKNIELTISNNLGALKDILTETKNDWDRSLPYYFSDEKISILSNMSEKIRNKGLENYQSLLTKSFFKEHLRPEKYEYYELDDETEEQQYKAKSDNLKTNYDTIISKFSKTEKVAEKEKGDLTQKLLDTSSTTKAKKIESEYEGKELEKSYLLEVVNHFSINSKEYKTKYINHPKLFLDNFEQYAKNYSLYQRSERLELITEKLLKLKNIEVYDSLCILLSRSNKIMEDIRNEGIIKEYTRLESQLYEIIQNKEYLSEDYFSIFYEMKADTIDFVTKRDSLTREQFWKRDYINNLQSFDYEEDSIRKKYGESIAPKIIERLKKLKTKNKNDSINLSKLELLKDSLKSKIESQLKSIDTFITSNPFLKSKSYKNTTQYYNCIKDITAEDADDFMYYCDYKRNQNFLDFEARKERQLELGKINTSILKQFQKVPLWDFEANDIQLDINDGFVEHIVVTGKITGISKQNDKCETFNESLEKFIENNPEWQSNIGKQLKFTNTYPYGFSSTKDFELLKKLKIFVYKGGNKQFEFELEKIFPNYVQTLQNDRLNFSPKDQVVNLPEPGKKDGGSVELKKEKSSKLFNILVYSDFVGLRAEQPNGVLQFEINKNIPLLTQKFPNFFDRYSRVNFGYFNFIEPQFTWSRLNASDNSKNLSLSYTPAFNGNEESSIPYVTHLDLLRFENISVGATLNLFTLDYSSAKVRFEINAGGKFGRTKVLDTKGKDITTANIDDEYDINTWRYYPELKIKLRPDERYGANLNFRWIRNNSVTNDFSTISSEEQFLENLTDSGKWLNQIEINAHFSPSGRKDDRFFFRYRYTNTTNWEYNGFSQIQVGYSMSLRM